MYSLSHRKNSRQGPIDPSPDEVAHIDHTLHKLGNLTLVSNKLDISIRNLPFAIKKQEMFEHDTLFLNKWFFP